MIPVQIRRRQVSVPPALHHYSGLIGQILASRGVQSPAEVQYELRGLSDPYTLSGMAAAIERLLQALEQQARVLIVGDFDADGATSTALAIQGLSACGFRRLDYLIPNRFDYGYGLTPEIVDLAAQREPDLIITVDNGISSMAGVARARHHGIDVLVTDHHLPGAELPAAYAIVNPNLPHEHFPSKHLAGVGVMFFVLIALRQQLRDRDIFSQLGIAEPNLAQFLDLVALGTVADVVPLDQQNRVLVEQGLRRIRAGHACPGINALLTVAGRQATEITSKDLGFFVGPRLNAAGRLDDMSWGIECLLSTSEQKALHYATDLDNLNRERREIETTMRSEALASLDELRLDDATLPWGLSLLQPNWHQGIVGLVAARIKERYHRPVIAFAPANEDTLKGSARSIPGLHIRDVLERIDSQQPGLIEKFGGHAMAAGLSLPAKHYAQFSAAFDQAVKGMLDPALLDPIITSDGELRADDMNLQTAQQLQRLAPWGQGFPEPIFDGVFAIQRKQILKERHIKYALSPLNTAHTFDALAFSVDPTEWPETGQQIHIAYSLDINRYRGATELQLMIRGRVDTPR